MLYHNRAPLPGEVMRFPDIAKTFRRFVELGKPGFYTGPVAESIVELVSSKSGVMSLEDLASHTSDFVTPMSYTYQGVTLHEVSVSWCAYRLCGLHCVTLVSSERSRYHRLDGSWNS